VHRNRHLQGTAEFGARLRGADHQRLRWSHELRREPDRNHPGPQAQEQAIASREKRGETAKN
jgi:hypothetical protein